MPAFKSYAATNGTAGSSITVAKPAGVVAGDLLIAMFTTQYATGAGPVNLLAGWTALASNTSSYPDCWFFYKFATASEPSSYVWSVSGGDGNGTDGVILAYGGNPLIDVKSAGLTVAPSTITIPGITNTQAGTLVLISTQRANAAANLSTPAGFTKQFGITPAASFRTEFFCADMASSVGATGSVTQTGQTYGIGGMLLNIYAPPQTGTIGWTDDNDTMAIAGFNGTRLNASIGWTDDNDTFVMSNYGTMISWGPSPSYIDNGQDGVASTSAALTGTPRLPLNQFTYDPNTIAVTDNSGSSPYVTLQQKGYNITAGNLGGNSGFAWPLSVAYPSQCVGGLSGTTLTITSMNSGGAAYAGQQVAVSGTTLPGPVQLVSLVSGVANGASVWTVTNPLSMSVPAGTALTLSKQGGLQGPGAYWIDTGSGVTGDAGLFSDAIQDTGASSYTVVTRQDGQPFAANTVELAPIPNYANNGNMYVKVTAYSGPQVTLSGNTLSLNGATKVKEQTILHTAGQAFAKFTLAGIANVTSLVMEAAGWANNNIVGGSPSNRPYYQFAYLDLVPSSPPQTGQIAWTDDNDTMIIAGTIPVTGLTGQIAWTDANDTMAIAGTLSNVGQIAWTEQGDTWSIAGSQPGPIAGQIAWADANDTMAITGNIAQPMTGQIAWTEDADVWQAFGTNGTVTTRARWRNMFY